MTVTNILPGLAGQPSENLIRDIEPGSTYIKALKERFARATKADLGIISCYELRQTPQSEFRTDGSIVRSGVGAMNAPESTACLYWANEIRVPINENHSMIAKLANREGSAYHTVVCHLAQLVVAAAAKGTNEFPPKIYSECEGSASHRIVSDHVWNRIKKWRSCYRQVERWRAPGKPSRVSKMSSAKIEVTRERKISKKHFKHQKKCRV